MAVNRHSYVRFFPSDWLAGTARLPRLHKSAYFDLCCYIWDAGKPVPEREARLMLADLPDAAEIIEDLISMEKLSRDQHGNISNDKAMQEAERAFEQWEKRSRGGKTARGTLGNSDGNTDGKSDEAQLPAERPSNNQNQNQNQTSPNGEGGAQARKHLCPEDFWPSPGEGTKTSEKMAGWSQDYLEQQVEKFIAHHRAKGNKYTDWSRAWTTWALNSFDERNGNGKRTGGDDFSRELERRLGAGSH